LYFRTRDRLFVVKMASKTKSVVWNFYEKSNDGGICKLCQCSVKTSDNTTNLKNHLKSKHPSINFDATIPKVRRNSLPTTSTTGDDNEDDPNIVLPETHYADLANEIISKVSEIHAQFLRLIKTKILTLIFNLMLRLTKCNQRLKIQH